MVRTRSAAWYDVGRWFFLSVPSHWWIVPDAEEIRTVFGQRPCLGVRYPTPVGRGGKPSYQLVCDRQDYDLDILSANVRSKVRRGLRRCEVRPVSFGELAARGWRADRDTLARQGRAPRLGAREWGRFWEAAGRTPNMEGWAAYAGGELAAFLVTVRFGDTVEFLLTRSRTDFLDRYPNNALIFTVTREMLVERGMRRVTFGLESLEAVDPLDRFKLGMGFRREPMEQRVVFHPVLARVLRRAVVRRMILGCAARWGRHGGVCAKAAGLLRFADFGDDGTEGVPAVS